MSRLIVAGAGGHGAVVVEMALELRLWAEIDLLDDQPAEPHVLGHAVVGTLDDLESLAEGNDVVVAVGDNSTRLKLLAAAERGGARLATLVHPRAYVSPSAQLSRGSVVCAGAVVGVRATIGVGCIVNTQASVDHDCYLGDAVHISPGAHLGGAVRIEDCGWIGIGACIREGINVGRDAVIAAGAAVVSDVLPGAIVMGVPAQPRL